MVGALGARVLARPLKNFAPTLHSKMTFYQWKLDSVAVFLTCLRASSKYLVA